jgi:hypothetical protein
LQARIRLGLSQVTARGAVVFFPVFVLLRGWNCGKTAPNIRKASAAAETAAAGAGQCDRLCRRIENDGYLKTALAVGGSDDTIRTDPFSAAGRPVIKEPDGPSGHFSSPRRFTWQYGNHSLHKG